MNIIKAINPQGVPCEVHATEKAFNLIFVPEGYKRATETENAPLQDQGGPSDPENAPALSLSDLRDLAKSMGIDTKGMNKQQLIEAIRAKDTEETQVVLVQGEEKEPAEENGEPETKADGNGEGNEPNAE